MLKGFRERKKERQKQRSEAKKIALELVKFFEQKHIYEKETETKLEDIIEKVNSNDILSKDFIFKIIIENIREYELGESEFRSEDIYLDLYQYVNMSI